MAFFNDLLGSLGISGGSGFIYTLISYVIWGLVIGVIFATIIIFARNKIKYQYQAVILKRRRDNIETGIPTAVSLVGKAGYFQKKKTGAWVYRIKWGMMPWQQMESRILPNPDHMIGNLAIFQQPQKDTLVQAKIDVNWKGDEKVFTIEPIADEIKHAVQLELKEADQILKTSKINPTVVGMTILGIIIIAFIIGFYFLSKAG